MHASCSTIALLGGLALVPAPLPAAVAGSDVYRFAVDLDGRDIGTHVFTVTRTADAIDVRSEAHFDVKLLGLTLYRYRHLANEHWAGGCLVRLTSTTDRNGKKGAVDWSAAIATGAVPECDSAFAYWDPALLARVRLLNPETGRFEKASLTGAAELRSLVAETATMALRYGPDGRWTSLESTTTDGRRLRYRLVVESPP